MPKALVRFAPLAILLAASGCDSLLSTDPGALRKISIIDYYEQPVLVTVPDTVNVGAQFQVQIRSYGEGCRSLGGTPVVVQGLTAQVAPYETQNNQSNCPAVLQTFDHVATLSFATAGTAQVIVIGAQQPENESVTLYRTVIVRP